ncbi:unnamed protein product [Toxocara canis]|uniref:Transposase n=1 Tax=Toxocara canis TaxID=6265 RepID=A0A183UY15_TOXCA|nr:unnamed protein product [Toxocara canis]
MASTGPYHYNVLSALEEHLTGRTRPMLRTEREKHSGNRAEIFCETLLTVARLLSNVQAARDQQAPFGHQRTSFRGHNNCIRPSDRRSTMELQRRDKRLVPTAASQLDKRPYTVRQLLSAKLEPVIEHHP